MLRRILFGGYDGKYTPVNLGLAILRIGAGLTISFGHGMGKIPPSDRFIEGVAKLGMPAPTFFAWMAALSECVGGLLLALGLLTRPAAFLLFCTMAVAIGGAHRNDPLFATGMGPSKEPALLFLIPALTLLFSGAGRYSIDALLRHRTHPDAPGFPVSDPRPA